MVEVRILLRRTAVVVLLSLVACIPDPRGDVGVGLSGDGSITVALALCTGDSLTSVLIARVVGDVIGDGDDEFFWQISRTGGIALSSGTLTIGNIPTGFEQQGEYVRPSDRMELAILVTTRDEEFVMDFMPAALDAGVILSEANGSVDVEEFGDLARQDC